MHVLKGAGAIAILAWGASALPAQTALDLRTQTRNVDFSAAASTRPAKTGTVLPATCSTGDFFFKTDAPAGINLYLCTSANTWTVVQGGGGGGGGDGTAQRLVSGTLAARPGSCAAGDVYFATDAVPGNNAFLCASANTWKQWDYAAGGTGALTVDCGTNPCTVDIDPSVVPRLMVANTWTGLQKIGRAHV